MGCFSRSYFFAKNIKFTYQNEVGERRYETIHKSDQTKQSAFVYADPGIGVCYLILLHTDDRGFAGFQELYESLCLMLPDTVLSMPVKYILVMFNLHNLCLWKPQKDLFRTRMIADAAFHINMGKPCIITHVL